MTSLNQDNIFTFLMCVAYMLTALAAVASYCVAGEYITSQVTMIDFSWKLRTKWRWIIFQGTRIFDQLYLCPWYRFKPEDRKILILMFMRSRKPVTISVGDFGSLSMIYFTQVNLYILTVWVLLLKPGKKSQRFKNFFRFWKRPPRICP